MRKEVLSLMNTQQSKLKFACKALFGEESSSSVLEGSYKLCLVGTYNDAIEDRRSNIWAKEKSIRGKRVKRGDGL